MPTIEIYESPTAKRTVYFCVYCGFNMTALGYCVDCNEYKGAVTLDEYIEMNGYYPKLKAVK
jgi:predicted ATP-dependent serine protease